MEKEWTVKQLAEYFGTEDVPEDSIAGYFKEQGFEQGRMLTARAMIRKGYLDSQICDLLEVTADYVARLRAEEV